MSDERKHKIVSRLTLMEHMAITELAEKETGGNLMRILQVLVNEALAHRAEQDEETSIHLRVAVADWKREQGGKQ